MLHKVKILISIRVATYKLGELYNSLTSPIPVTFLGEIATAYITICQVILTWRATPHPTHFISITSSGCGRACKQALFYPPRKVNAAATHVHTHTHTRVSHGAQDQPVLIESL